MRNFISLLIIFFAVINTYTQDRPGVHFEKKLFGKQELDNFYKVATEAGALILYSKNFESPIKQSEPFLAVAYKLFGENLSLNSVRVEIKFALSNNWYQFPEDEDSENSELVLSSGLVFIDEFYEELQFRITKSDANTNINSIEFIFINPGKTSESKLEELKKYEPINFIPDLTINSPNNVSEKSNLLNYPRPPMVTRTEWGCPQGQGSLGSPSLTFPTHLIVHHSAGSNSSNDWPAVVRSIYILHTQSNGWSDIGYNWLIDANGVIYQGRAWYQNTNDNVLGAHFCGTNSNTMGVCVMGTYTSVSPTDAAKTSLAEILAYKADERNINPLGISYHVASGLNLYNISGHRNGCATECPGTNLYNQLPDIRNNVNNLLNPTSVNENNILIDQFRLEQNYPNPFNPETKITYIIPVQSFVTIKVYDLLGREISELVNELKMPGYYEINFDGGKIPSGTYFYELRAGDFLDIKKMILLK